MMQECEHMFTCSQVCNNNNSNDKKRHLHIKITREIDEKLRSLIMQKYSKIEKGLISFEIEMALRHWLALHTNAQISKGTLSQPNPTPKVMLAFAQVKDYLLRKYYFELPSGAQVNIKHLEEAIANTRGSDSRTIRKWIRTFHKMKLIKPITSALWEIL